MKLEKIVEIFKTWDKPREFVEHQRTTVFEAYAKKKSEDKKEVPKKKTPAKPVSKKKTTTKAAPVKKTAPVEEKKPTVDEYTNIIVSTKTSDGKEFADALKLYDENKAEELPDIILDLPKLGLEYMESITALSDIPKVFRRSVMQLRTAIRRPIPIRLIRRWLNGDAGQLGGIPETIIDNAILLYAKNTVKNQDKSKPIRLSLSEMEVEMRKKLMAYAEKEYNKRYNPKFYELYGPPPQKPLMSGIHVDGEAKDYRFIDYLVWRICMNVRVLYGFTPEEWSEKKDAVGGNRMFAISTGHGDAIADSEIGMYNRDSQDDTW